LSLGKELLNTGILQFGRFVQFNKVVPVRFCPEYLPAYPELLMKVATTVLSQIKHCKTTHLLVNSSTIPLGVACSLQSKASLVYSRGVQQPSVYDLVGAYNSGDKSILLVNSVDDVMKVTQLITEANSVGLDVQQVIAFLEMHHIQELAALSITSVLRLVDLTSELVSEGALSERQGQAVLNWVNDG
jgi:hypothetical protein